MTAPVLDDKARAALARNDRWPISQADGLIGVAPPGALNEAEYDDDHAPGRVKRFLDGLVLRCLVLPFLRLNERLIRWRCGPRAIIVDHDQLGVLAELEAHWPEIREEVEALLAASDTVPLSTFVPDLVGAEGLITSRGGSWHGFAIIDPKGWWIDRNAARCPRTSEVLRNLTGGVQTALFSVLAPHTVLPTHQGPNKGQLTVHLGVIVPDPPGSSALQAGDETVAFAEGVAFAFDDTNMHTAWNEGNGTRVSLAIQVERPLPWPASWTNKVAQRLFPMYAYPRGGWGRFLPDGGEERETAA